MILMIVYWRGLGIFRAFHKLFEIVQEVSRNVIMKLLKTLLKLRFLLSKITGSCALKSCSKKQNLLWSDAKICKLYNKIKISKHFCPILWRFHCC